MVQPGEATPLAGAFLVMAAVIGGGGESPLHTDKKGTLQSRMPYERGVQIQIVILVA